MKKNINVIFYLMIKWFVIFSFFSGYNLRYSTTFFFSSWTIYSFFELSHSSSVASSRKYLYFSTFIYFFFLSSPFDVKQVSVVSRSFAIFPVTYSLHYMCMCIYYCSLIFDPHLILSHASFSHYPFQTRRNIYIFFHLIVVTRLRGNLVIVIDLFAPLLHPNYYLILRLKTLCIHRNVIDIVEKHLPEFGNTKAHLMFDNFLSNIIHLLFNIFF